MNDTLFRRSFRVAVGNKLFESINGDRSLSVSFHVQRDASITPNVVNLQVLNLSDATRSELSEMAAGAGVPVRLDAGYQEQLGTIFFGAMRRLASWRDGTEWITHLSGDDKGDELITAKISRTFVAGTKVSEVVRVLVTALGVDRGALDNTLRALDLSGLLTGGNVLPRPLTLHGDAATALDQLMRSCGLYWSIADGAFVAGSVGQPALPGQGPLITPDTGLVDTPHFNSKGALVGRALLNPDLLPGRVFRVQSTRVTGTFLCSKTIHRGDSFGRDWYVDFIGTPPAAHSKAALLATALGDTGF